MIDVFEIKLHYPIPIFLYTSNIKSIYEFYKFLSELKNDTLVIPLENFEFITIDELDISKSYRLKSVLVPKGEILVKFFLGLLEGLNIYYYFLPIVEINPIGKKLLNKKRKNKNWSIEWKSFLRYINLIKDRMIKFEVFENEFLSLIISNVSYKEPLFYVGELVKLKNKSVYGRIVELREKSVFLDNGEFYNKSDLITIKTQPETNIKHSDSKFMIEFLLKYLNRELIKYGLELVRKEFDFEKVEISKDCLKDFLKNKRINLVFKSEKIKEKFSNFKFPFILDENSEYSFLIDSPRYLKSPKKLYKEVSKLFLNLDHNCPRVYSKIPVKLKLKDGRYLISNNYNSAICNEEEINIGILVL
ncbi:MAG: hypothetical protein N2504_01540 [candidate division WOR-3 bacterium]|nr:hypothetical protein [candidate division WOR-3 bacterium]MCX7947253.1 hypothetical protein [candidate division WOR-3 bacterium]MDW8150190.1 hypothetical protein [candidate division WOR-3 bacterium]